MAKGFMYLTAIIDLHTRFVLNWSVHTMSAIGADILKLYKVWCA
jgi:transposase InsO family protein